jgi:hypothetical protein
LREESSGDAEDQFENAVQEACWCIGNLVGYLRHAASDNTRRHIDLRLHESYLNRFSTANQWKAYRVALRDTEYRHRFLLESVQAYRSLPAVSQENQAPESGSISGAATATSGLSSKSSTSRSRDFRYSDYRSCDVSSLAIETLATLPSRAFSERHVSL